MVLGRVAAPLFDEHQARNLVCQHAQRGQSHRAAGLHLRASKVSVLKKPNRQLAAAPHVVGVVGDEAPQQGTCGLRWTVHGAVGVEDAKGCRMVRRQFQDGEQVGIGGRGRGGKTFHHLIEQAHGGRQRHSRWSEVAATHRQGVVSSPKLSSAERSRVTTRRARTGIVNVLAPLRPAGRARVQG